MFPLLFTGSLFRRALVCDYLLRCFASLFQRAWQNGLPRIAEFEFGCTGFDGLGLWSPTASFSTVSKLSITVV
jgi:hypothetical protein